MAALAWGLVSVSSAANAAESQTDSDWKISERTERVHVSDVSGLVPAPGPAAASGLRPYNTCSGLRDVHFNVDLTYKISSHWSANISAVAGRLERFAAGSPITERRLDLSVMASRAYRF